MWSSLNKDILKLYFIMGSVNANSPLDVVEAALQGGITCFQLREKGNGALEGNEKYLFAEKCKELCQRYNVPFIINDDVELAIALNADGVHIGQEDEKAEVVRELLGPSKLLGVSVHNPDEAYIALKNGADYVGMGPVYPTSSKSDAKAPAGTSMIKRVAQLYPNLPIVGIGGITENNLTPVIEAGSLGVAVISAIASSEQPAEKAKGFLEKVNGALRRARR